MKSNYPIIDYDIDMFVAEAAYDRDEAIKGMSEMLECFKQMRKIFDSYPKKGDPATEKLIADINKAIMNYSLRIDELKTKPAYLPRRQTSKKSSSDDVPDDNRKKAEKKSMVKSSGNTETDNTTSNKFSLSEFIKDPWQFPKTFGIILAVGFLLIVIYDYTTYRCLEHSRVCGCDHPITHMIELSKTKAKLDSIEIKQLDEIRRQQLERLTNHENKTENQSDSVTNNTK